MSALTLTVAQLNDYVRRQLAMDPMLNAVKVSGEISGFKRHYSGHMYFALKDDQARVSCVMFRQNTYNLTFEPRDGMHVTLMGSASLYAQTGSFQLYAESMIEQGVGELFVKFEALKAKLMAEGLFDPSIKKPLMMMPNCVGIVTSRSGAVLRDIVRVIQRRYPNMSIVLCSCAVQGVGAAEEIASAIDRLNAHGQADVILCGRGGGSMEDLWAFNEEVVARAIVRSNIPVISCVGHETDFTIADFVADVRAATPSVAAELAVPVKAELALRLEEINASMKRALYTQMKWLRARLQTIASSPVFTQPKRVFIDERIMRLTRLDEKLLQGIVAQIREKKMQLSALNRALSALNPSAVINRGYAVITGEKGILTGIEQLHIDQKVGIQLRDGHAQASVTEITGRSIPKRQEAAHGGEKESKL